MAHTPRIVTCQGPQDPHAFDGISPLPRTGKLDEPCPHCRGHGQWNREFDLASQRSKRCLCDRCEGRAWIETGEDPLPIHDTELSEEGYPRWTVRLKAPGGSDGEVA